MKKFIIKQTTNGYKFDLLASNGQIILTSELYTTKEACEKGIESVVHNVENIENFERKISKNGKFYFNLKAENGLIVGTSELYESEAARENGIYSVMKNALITE